MRPLKNSTYDFLKWLALIALPASATYVLQVGEIWGWADYVRVAKTINCTALLIGCLIGVSTVAYNKFVKLQSAEEPDDSYVDETDDIDEYEVFDYGDEINIEGGDEND